MRDIINGVCYQRCEKRLEQQEGRPNVNVCDAEENLEEELLCINKPVFNDRFISNKHTQYVFVRNTTFLSFFPLLLSIRAIDALCVALHLHFIRPDFAHYEKI